MRAAKRHSLGGWWMCGLLLGALALGGCTRRFYRERADDEVNQVLGEKDRYPFWKVQNYHVYPDPRARFADPTNPDRPPMPPDDPAAYYLSPNPQKPGKAGVARVEGEGYLRLLEYWDSMNRDREAQKKDPAQIVPAPLKVRYQKDEGPELLPKPAPTPGEPTVEGPCPGSVEHPFKITLEQAVELGLINSREFQTRREDLYLAALPVTLQRFSFASQFFATAEAIRLWAGNETPGGRRNEWNITTTGGFSKLFSTGATLLLRFANQTIIDLTGNRPRHTISETTLNLDLVQPLLQGGGKAVTLEPLTQAERDLLYEVRDYARFRKGFFVNIATGGEFDVFNVQPVRQGYLPTLRRIAQLAVNRKSVSILQQLLKVIEAFQEGGELTPLQVAQTASQLLNAQSSVLRGEQDVQDALDLLKRQLGLPMTVHLTLDDSPLRPITQHLDRIENIQKDLTAAVARATKLENEPPAKLRQRLKQALATEPIVQGTRFAQTFPAQWKEWEIATPEDIEKKVRDLRAERRKLLNLKADIETAGKEFPLEQQRRLEEIDHQIDVGLFEGSLRRYEAQPWMKEPDQAKRKDLQGKAFRDVVNDYALVLNEPRRQQLERWRQEWPRLAPIELHGLDLLEAPIERVYDTASHTALAHRLDLMNQRALVTDAWRKIAVAANSLLGVFDVEYHLSSFSPRGLAQPLALDGSRVEHQLVLNAQLPLVRKAERNAYRATLIDFQRQRRSLMAAEDNVASTIRREIRQLRVFAENYKIQQRSMELAYLTLESALETLQAPPGGGAPGGVGGGPAGGTAAQAASLTDQLLRQQQNLVRAQSEMFQLWIDYQISRLQFYRDLEWMTLDFRGVWNDELASRQSHRPGDARLPNSLPANGPHGERPVRLEQPHGAVVPPRLLAPAATSSTPGN